MQLVGEAGVGDSVEVLIFAVLFVVLREDIFTFVLNELFGFGFIFGYRQKPPPDQSSNPNYHHGSQCNSDEQMPTAAIMKLKDEHPDKLLKRPCS